jgi:hypothetical protein
MLIGPKQIVKLNFWKEILEEREIDPYSDSTFLPLKQMSSKKKGKYFETLVEEFFLKKGYSISKPESSDHDRIINDLKVEIKGSFLWGDGTHFRWQQIRPNQDYDIICFVAVYPNRIEIYGATKEDCKKYLEVQDENGQWIYNQHGGKKVNSGTFVIDGFPEDFSWFKKIEELI